MGELLGEEVSPVRYAAPYFLYALNYVRKQMSAGNNNRVFVYRVTTKKVGGAAREAAPGTLRVNHRVPGFVSGSRYPAGNYYYPYPTGSDGYYPSTIRVVDERDTTIT